MTQVVAPNGATTDHGYNGFGDLEQLTSPDTGVTSYTYDEAGNRLSQTDARGITTSYSYDALNRLTSISYPDSSLDVTFTYDQGTGHKGRLTSMSDGSGTTVFGYDVFGNLIQEDRTIQSVTYVTQYEYDAANNLTAIVYPSGRRVDYTRNVLGQVSAVDTTYDGNSQNVASALAYQPFGPLSGLTFGNGLSLSRSYDQAYRIDDLATGNVQSLDYTLDPAGNITAITDTLDATYSQSFGYDALHRLDNESGSYGDKSYVYDPVGNRESRSFDDSQQILTQTLTYVANSNRLATHDGATVVIDAAGNTTDDSQGATFAYGDHNRMLSASVGGTQVATYAYNGMGQRVRKTLTGGTQETTVLHFGLGGEILGETVYDSGGDKIKETDIIWLDGMPIAQSEREYDSQGTVTSSQFVYIHADHLNTPRLATDSSGTVVWRWRSDAFGIGDTDTDPDGDGTDTEIGLRFPGQFQDLETGLTNNYLRDNDPSISRYIESDPIGLMGGINTYGYALQNPVAYYDPQGTSAWGLARGAFWIGTRVGAAINYGIQAATGVTLGVLLYEAFNESSDSDNVIPFPDVNSKESEQCPDPNDPCERERQRLQANRQAGIDILFSGIIQNPLRARQQYNIFRRQFNISVNLHNAACPSHRVDPLPMADEFL